MLDIEKYELKKWPKPPKAICQNSLYHFLGIVSPSLVFSHQFSYDGTAMEEIDQYFLDIKRYHLYKRTLTKSGYRELVRIIKSIEKKEYEIRYLTNNPDVFIENVLGIKLFPYQKFIIKEAFKHGR